MGSRYHVKIAGQGFLLRPGSYKRTASTPDSSLITRHSSLSPGWRHWSQSDWRGGDGQRMWDGETGGQGDGGSWRSGYGIDVGEAGGVRLGPTLASSFASTEDGFAAMLAFAGKLYALSASSGKIYSYDGSVWGVDHDTGKSAMGSLARHGDRLYAGSGSDGTVFVGDGATWSIAFQVEGATSISCMASYGVWDSTARATVPRLFLGCLFASGEARIYQWDGSAATEVHGCRETRAEAMAVYGGRLYVATSDAGSAAQGRVLCFDGRSTSGEWSEALWLPDNYVAGWAVFDNLLFCGSGAGGKVWAFDGSRMAEAYSLSGLGLEYVEPLRGMSVHAGRLYVAYGHPTQGLALLAKLGDGEWGMGNGNSTNPYPPSPNPQVGWFTPCTVGIEAAPGALAVYDGHLYVGSEAAGAATIYRMDPGSYRSSGLLETSLLDGGQPGTAKRLRSLTMSHDKLLAGHYLEASFALEGSDSFQQVEDFGDLAGCDRASTTADWRTGGGGVTPPLLRLKGMPAQGFTGKTRGNPSVPHVARKLVSIDPNSPPAAFVEEFDDAEYATISAIGDGVAVTPGTADGSYAHQLFQFELGGLNPAGLRPRAVAYGKGDSFGALARGVVLRIWNHTTNGWDVVGSNAATPEDDVASRTIEATVVDFGCYLGVSRRLYLSLRSSYAGSAANPSEVGSDLVEVGALWASEGDVVSEPLRLPVSGPVSGATLTLLSSQLPSGTGIELYMSADGGANWEAVESGVEHSFAHPGSSLRWKARLSTADGLSTPLIDRLKVDYFTGSWIPLGRSDTEGSTSATFPFESGVAARRMAFRVEMGSSDPSSSPVLAGIALQYALKSEMKRRWEFDLLCEGVAGIPLKLLDGSKEARTGLELSQILWQARSRETVSFEDVDGTLYQVWFDGLEERLSDATQDRGPQTVARCVLTEC